MKAVGPDGPRCAELIEGYLRARCGVVQRAHAARTACDEKQLAACIEFQAERRSAGRGHQLNEFPRSQIAY
jgi:hypothetical protein